MNLFNTPSVLEKYIWRDREFYIKRDDLLHPFLNGNKARKFQRLLQMELKGKTLISYGGNQSNAMVALSFIAKIKHCNFIYITPPLSKYLQNNLEGNLAYALNNKIHLEFCCGDVEKLKNKALEISETLGNQALFISQGGAFDIAKIGIEKLALELFSDTKELKNPAIFYTSGSGASAGYLAEFFPHVFSTPVAGNANYLKSLFQTLNPKSLVNIISSKTKIPFAKPHPKLYEIYQEWLEIGIEFDLIYDCFGWLCLYENIDLFEDKEIVFIHSGGILGNITQKKRYERLFDKQKNQKIIS